MWSLLLLLTLSPQNTKAQMAVKKIDSAFSNSLTAELYAALPQLGSKVKSLPKQGKTIKFQGNRYAYKDGVFYQRSRGRYLVVSAPIGIEVSEIPATSYRVALPAATYFYYYGNFYRRNGLDRFEVIAPPSGAIVNALPRGYHLYRISGREYFVHGDTYYQCIQLTEEENLFEVASFESM